jgi:predicted pyridoxine 5'-phosphate oxidase superfamily flavin-nucleotide-binding protein
MLPASPGAAQVRPPLLSLGRIPAAAQRVQEDMGTFHEGERAVQAHAGVAAEARGLGRGISSGIPPGAQPFLEAQRLAVLAGVDAAGHVWASLVTGNPGFITAPSSRTLRLAARLSDVDPLTDGLSSDRPLGLLVIDPERRRRLRVNGRVIRADRTAIEIATEEVFGNCPKYIQARAPEDAAAHPRGAISRWGTTLTVEQGLAIERADTLFIASVHATRGADASHRGGQPGFVRVLDERRLRVPDYAGNNMFQTLGNIAIDPRVGLLFVAFDTGTTLQLTGRARVLWEVADRAGLPGAERAVEVEVDEVVEIAGQGPLGWRFVEYSPFNPR